MLMYCLKCREKTETNNEHERTTSNGRNMISGTCKVCGTKKNLFVRS